MRKKIILGILLIGIGYLLGEVIFGDKKELIKSLKNTETYYFLQEGVYTDLDILQNNISKLSQKIIDYKEDKYFVYVGITKDKEVAEILTEIYEKNGYQIYPKEKNLTSEEFSENVSQFDLLIKETEEEDQILTIEKVVLANYEEMIKK